MYICSNDLILVQSDVSRIRDGWLEDRRRGSLGLHGVMTLEPRVREVSVVLKACITALIVRQAQLKLDSLCPLRLEWWIACVSWGGGAQALGSSRQPGLSHRSPYRSEEECTEQVFSIILLYANPLDLIHTYTVAIHNLCRYTCTKTGLF